MRSEDAAWTVVLGGLKSVLNDGLNGISATIGKMQLRFIILGSSKKFTRQNFVSYPEDCRNQKKAPTDQSNTSQSGPAKE
jgi:hypothetical protein